jgi:hypothetical protein
VLAEPHCEDLAEGIDDVRAGLLPCPSLAVRARNFRDRRDDEAVLTLLVDDRQLKCIAHDNTVADGQGDPCARYARGMPRGNWQQLELGGFALTLDYPAVTPQGVAVERADARVADHPVAGDFERVHLTSPGSGEVYVELARFPDRTPQDEHAAHRPPLEQRFGAGAVSELSETFAAGRQAWVYDFRWDSGERSVLLFDVEGDTYRVIQDPRSELNAEILGTLAIRD